jgi:uncharacterized protein
MLIEFSVSNFRSFREKQTLTLAASKYFREHSEFNCFETGIKGLPKLLRSAVIYGPNASGKSNLISSLSFMSTMVLSSAKKVQEGEELPVSPFLLDMGSKDKPSEFEIIFVEDGIRYQYGFALDKRRIHSEWLIVYPGGRPQKWFDRQYNPDRDEDSYEFGAKFLGGRLRQDWKNATRSNALFVSVAVQFNSEQLRPIFNWFQKRLTILQPPTYTLFPVFTSEVFKTEEGKDKVITFLKSADLSIADIIIKKEKIAIKQIDSNETEIPEKFRKLLNAFNVLEGEEVDMISFVHKNMDTGEPISFHMNEESNGTRNLFGFAGYWVKMMASSQVLIVDEIDASLHPLIVHQLVRLLHQSGSKAQLVFTTHDTTILSQDIMRRDQIWFIEKDNSNASRLYPLSDFRVREHEALEKGYLLGRYGAIPVIKDLIVT